MRDFFIEIEVEKDGKIVTLDTDDMDINIYQKIDGRKVRIFEIICYDGVKGPVTVAEFVGKKNYTGTEMNVSPQNIMSVYSE